MLYIQSIIDTGFQVDRSALFTTVFEVAAQHNNAIY